tara:strand:+ start:1275 stop:1445 length:171 start_codon:yes stop_codon:yes gene_type:complete
MIEITKFLIGCAIFGAFAMIKPTISFVGSFSEPCKSSFYNSTTLFEATRGCILRGK